MLGFFSSLVRMLVKISRSRHDRTLEAICKRYKKKKKLQNLLGRFQNGRFKSCIVSLVDSCPLCFLKELGFVLEVHYKRFTCIEGQNTCFVISFTSSYFSKSLKHLLCFQTLSTILLFSDWSDGLIGLLLIVPLTNNAFITVSVLLRSVIGSQWRQFYHFRLSLRPLMKQH